MLLVMKKNNTKSAKAKPSAAATKVKPAPKKTTTPKPAAAKKPAAVKKPAPAKKPVTAAKPAKKAAAPAPKKPCKADAKKTCCGKKNCACAVDADKLVAEIFGALNNTAAVETLLKDYFFTELIKKNIDEEKANTMANNLTVQIENFDATIF